jgi:2-dehydro-3-deoxyphosphogluconate aldolase / (4S)-4-hydroxy-2-oxoglutarate aldolase
MTNPAAIMQLAPVVPVLVIEDVAHARPIAEALVAGGLFALEVTLRTAAALEVIAEMADLRASIDAGAKFIVSPGLTEPLGKAAIASGIPFLPGIANAGDIMRGLDLGLTHFKFFPAEASGGIKALKALAGPFGQCKFCPTGGITQASAPDWLAIEAVLCVGGSWIVPPGAPDAAAITAAARLAAQL